MSPRARWRLIGATSGWRSRTVTAVLLLAGIVWLFWPIIDSYAAPSRRQADAEAPWVLSAMLALLLLLGSALWAESGHSVRVLGALGSLTAANVLVRAWVTPRMMGFEPVFVLPMLTGMAFGAPAGALVGALSCVASSMVIDAVSSALPGQLIVWAGLGALGGLLVRTRPVLAWLWSLVLGLVAGPPAGMLLNLTGWPMDGTPGDSGFFPGLSPGQNLLRLVRYDLETSVVYDAMRGVSTAAGLLLVGLPLLVGLRQVWGTHPRHTTAGLLAAPRDRISPESLSRRRRAELVGAMWARPDPARRPEDDPPPAGSTTANRSDRHR